MRSILAAIAICALTVGCGSAGAASNGTKAYQVSASSICAAGYDQAQAVTKKAAGLTVTDPAFADAIERVAVIVSAQEKKLEALRKPSGMSADEWAKVQHAYSVVRGQIAVERVLVKELRVQNILAVVDTSRSLQAYKKKVSRAFKAAGLEGCA